MISLRRQLVITGAKLYDLAVMILSFGLAAALVAQESAAVSFADFLSMRIKIRNFVMFLGFLLIWHIIFCNCALYDSRRLSKGWREAVDAVRATTLGTAFLCIAGFLFRLSIVTPVFLAGFWTISSCAIVLNRLLARQLLARGRIHGRNLRDIIIVGTNSRAIEVARKIESKPALGYRIRGFADEQWRGTSEFLESGYRLVSDLARFPNWLREQVIDEVLIALPMRSQYLEACQVATLCDQHGIITRVLPDLFDLRLARIKAEDFEDISVITLSRNPKESWQHLLKRVLDIVLSVAAIVVFLPLGIVTALLIKLTSPGEVFFVQERVGFNKRVFRVYKFRSMVADAAERQREVEHLNEVAGPVFKIRKDPRITPLGTFLRKASIDELPQLFNVLKGDMSLVGPRPLPVRDCAGFSEDWQRRRFSVRPGITCLWQVSGRSSVSFDRWMELDMQYIDQWSLGLDLKILAKTIPAVLKGAGAA